MTQTPMRTIALILKPPILDDEDKTRAARLLNVISLAFLVIIILCGTVIVSADSTLNSLFIVITPHEII